MFGRFSSLSLAFSAGDRYQRWHAISFICLFYSENKIIASHYFHWMIYWLKNNQLYQGIPCDDSNSKILEFFQKWQHWKIKIAFYIKKYDSYTFFRQFDCSSSVVFPAFNFFSVQLQGAICHKIGIGGIRNLSWIDYFSFI